MASTIPSDEASAPARCQALISFNKPKTEYQVILCLAFTGVLFFFQAEDGIRDDLVTGVQTCAPPIFPFLSRRLRRERKGKVGTPHTPSRGGHPLKPCWSLRAGYHTPAHGRPPLETSLVTSGRIPYSPAEAAAICTPNHKKLLHFDFLHGRLRDYLLKLCQSYRRWQCFLLLGYHCLFPGNHAAFVEQDRQDNNQPGQAVYPPGPAQGHNCRCDDYVKYCQWQQQGPAKAHQAVIANARQGGAQPDEQEKENCNFD